MQFSNDNSQTVELMRLFQDNVKKVSCITFDHQLNSFSSFEQDIVITSDIVNLIEKRMENLYKDLASLKEAKNDVNKINNNKINEF